MVPKMQFSAVSQLFRSRREELSGTLQTVRHVDSTGINRLAVRRQHVHFMKSLFLKIQKLQKRKIEIIVGISVFVEGSKSLLPTLGRSANLNEPRVPR